MMMVKEQRDIKPLLLKFGVALAISFAGFLYSRLRTKRINPSPPPPSPRSLGSHFFLISNLFIVDLSGPSFKSMF